MRRSTLVWIAVVVAGLVAAGLTIRAYGPELKHWMIRMHGGGRG